MDNLNNRKKKAIWEVFENASWDMLHLVEDILDRIDWEELENDPYDQVAQAVDDSLIYYDDQWTVAKYYSCGPADLDWQNAIYTLLDDIHDIIDRVIENK